MNDVELIIKRLEEYIGNKKGKKLFQRDIAKELGMDEGSLSTAKKRNRIPYEYICTYCAQKRLNINRILYGQTKRLLDDPALRTKVSTNLIFTNPKNSRDFIIDTIFNSFDGIIAKTQIEKAMIEIGAISAVSKEWLKEHWIDKQLSAKECGAIAGCSEGHIQKLVKKFGMNKKKFGIKTGNNEAHRRMRWRQKIQNSQPNKKPILAWDKDLNLVGIYPSISAGADALSAGRTHVRDCLSPKKQRKSANGFTFEFVSDYIDIERKEFDEIKEELQQYLIEWEKKA